MTAVVTGWKIDRYGHLPSSAALASANEGHNFYMTIHPGQMLKTILVPNTYSGLSAFVEEKLP
jgi:hypothetical protein